jgi:hypothetical protein
MTKLGRSIRGLAKHGNNMRAIVISCARETATVRLAGNGAVYRTLRVVGGPVSVGQQVQVDMSSDIPYIVAPSITTEVTIDTLYKQEEPRRAIPAATIIEGMILRYAGSVLKEGYPFSVTGMTDCLADCETGNTIVYPEGTLEMDFTLPATITLVGVNYDVSIFWGTITLSASSKINDLYILKELSSAEDAIALIGPSIGVATLKDVRAEAFNCGFGRAIGLYGLTGDVNQDTSIIRGESTSGLGYGVYQS